MDRHVPVPVCAFDAQRDLRVHPQCLYVQKLPVIGVMGLRLRITPG